VTEGILDTPPIFPSTPSREIPAGSVTTQATGKPSQAVVPPLSAASPEMPEQVPFNSQIRFATYLRIKQAQFYDRVKIKDLTDQALNYYLNQFEGADTPLPPKVLQEVLNQGKIKGYKKRGG
jgi:hypothetical protein